MAEKYFEKFPIITYSNNSVRDITARTVVLNSVYNNPVLYYTYNIVPGERPDNIADRYYKDEYAGWVLHLINNVTDPYYEWYMDQETFKDFLGKKYGSYINAISKVKYYRNNWYSYQDPITEAQYNAIDPSLKKFFEPIYTDDYYSTTPIGYKRKREDWIKSTNQIVSYNANGASFIFDEVVDVYQDTAKIGSGQVCSKANTFLTIQHTSGIVTANTLGTYTIRGRESEANSVYNVATLLTNNIPSVELNYWEPVYYYDYENEINEKNKTIRVLKSNYVGQISKDLKTLLK